MTCPQLTADDELLPFQDELDRVLHTFNRAMRHADRAHWTGESESGGHDEAWKAKTEAKAAIISWADKRVVEARITENEGRPMSLHMRANGSADYKKGFRSAVRQYEKYQAARADWFREQLEQHHIKDSED